MATACAQQTSTITQGYRAHLMNQLRLDPLTGRWVVVSTDRAARPRPSPPGSRPIQADTSRPCPFCPGNEESATPALETSGPDGNWLVRVVPNLYPAFEGNAPFVVTNRGPVFTQATAGGIHEVIVLSPDHQNSWPMLSDEQTAAVMVAMRDRIEEHSQIPGLRYSQAIVNAGREAGASIEHPHGQLLGHVLRPPRAGRGTGRVRPVRRTVPAVHDGRRRGERRPPGGLRRRAGAGHLPVLERGALRDAGHPPGPRPPPAPQPAEPTWWPWARRSRWPWAACGTWSGDIAYNLVFHSAPYRAPEPYHWHVHVVPKLTTVAGFELGTGVLINIVNPEEAAEELAVRVPVARAG